MLISAGQGASNGRGVVAWWRFQTSQVALNSITKGRVCPLLLRRKWSNCWKRFLSVFRLLSNSVAGARVWKNNDNIHFWLSFCSKQTSIEFSPSEFWASTWKKSTFHGRKTSLLPCVSHPGRQPLHKWRWFLLQCWPYGRGGSLEESGRRYDNGRWFMS